MTNIERLRHAYSAWSDSLGTSTETWMALAADDITLRSLADGAPGMEFTAPRSGPEEIRHYFDGLHLAWQMLSYHVEDYIEEGNRVVVVGRHGFRHKQTGKTVHSTFAHIWRFRDGKVFEFTEFYDTAKAIAATQPD